MQLSKLDAELLDLALDDYYGLGEVRDAAKQLMPDAESEAVVAMCKERLLAYVQTGLAEIFVERMTRDEFRLVPPEEVASTLNSDSSWATPTGDVEVVAMLSTKRAEQLLFTGGRNA